MQDDNRGNCGCEDIQRGNCCCNNNCGCGNGLFGGLFGGNNCGCGDNGILFFIIVFLLLFTNCGCNR